MNYFSKFTKTLLLAVVIFLGSFLSVSASGADIMFTSGAGVTGGGVMSSAIQSDGKIVIAGYFTAYDGVSRSGIARINTDGSLDTSFDPGTGISSYSTFGATEIVIQPDGKIIIGGEFTVYDGVSRSGIARINTDGSLDTSFDPGTGATSYLTGLALQPDGKIIIGGTFYNYNGVSRSKIARINTDGSLDTSFDPGTGANSNIRALALQSDGKIIIGGEFTVYDGVSRSKIARINTDGSLDTSFDPGTGPSSYPHVLALQPDGKIIIGGSFTTYGGVSRSGIARINTDGSLDTSFDPGTGANNGVFALAFQPDGKIIILGSFTTYGGVSRSKIARINTDGSLDTSFDPTLGITGGVYFSTLSLQLDGKVIAGGDFSGYDGVYARGIVRIFFVPYVLKYTAGTNGSISGDLTQYIDPGQDGSAVTAVPNEGYYFVNWSDLSIENPRTDLVIQEDNNIVANFQKYINVAYYSNGGGTIIGNSSQEIISGEDSVPVVAIPDPGYRFLYWDDSSINPIRNELSVIYDTYIGASFESLTCGVINTGNYPISAITVGTRLYVMNSGENTVSVIDTINNVVIDIITVGNAPNSGTLVGTKLYVMNSADDTVSVIDTTDNSVSAPIAVGDNPLKGILIGTDLYVLNNNNATVSVIDTTTNTITDTVTVGNNPYFATVVGTKLYVLNQNDSTVSVIDTTDNTVLSTVVMTGYGPTYAVVVGINLYIINGSDLDYTTGAVTVIDTTDDTVSDTISVGNYSTSAIVVGTKLYVVNSGAGTVSVIDTTTNTITDTVTVGANSAYPVIVGTDLYILNQDENTISVIDTTDNSVSAPITVGITANYMTLVGTKIYVVNPYDQNYVNGSVTVVDTSTNAIIPCATTYSCAYLSGTNGSITGSTFQTVIEGANTTAVTAVPESGYVFEKWSDNSTQNPRTDTNVQANTIVTASFITAPNTFTLTYTPGTGGTISGNTTQTVALNDDGTAVTAVPDSGYSFTRWSDNSTANPRTDTNVTSDLTISAVFTAIPSSGGGGGGPTTGGVTYGCTDRNALNYQSYVTNYQPLCKYATTTTTTTPTKTLGTAGICPVLLTQNLKFNSRNGKYNSYTKGIVKEAKILQSHLNRLGFSSGKEDGILGPKSEAAIKRMQTFLNTKPDGYVGPLTRALINNSCGKK